MCGGVGGGGDGGGSGSGGGIKVTTKASSVSWLTESPALTSRVRIELKKTEVCSADLFSVPTDIYDMPGASFRAVHV